MQQIGVDLINLFATYADELVPYAEQLTPYAQLLLFTSAKVQRKAQKIGRVQNSFWIWP